MRSDSTDVPEGVRVFPNIWPGADLKAQPGDITKFDLMGCYGGPLTMRQAEDDDFDISRDFRVHGLHPVHDAPVTESRGGVLYFDSVADTASVMSAFGLMGADTGLREYAVFVSQSQRPVHDRFLVQCKLIPIGALNDAYHGAGVDAIEDGAAPQPLTLGEFFRGFIEVQRRRWNASAFAGIEELAADDDRWELGFGFLMENPCSKACRIWSRPWLVEK
jgi:hypothetical protein